jgi:hypothetical protein
MTFILEFDSKREKNENQWNSSDSIQAWYSLNKTRDKTQEERCTWFLFLKSLRETHGLENPSKTTIWTLSTPLFLTSCPFLLFFRLYHSKFWLQTPDLPSNAPPFSFCSFFEWVVTLFLLDSR